MRKQALAIATMLLLSIVVTAGHADGQEPVLKAKIPFEFAVGSQILPAGEYWVERLSPGMVTVLLLQCADNRASAAASSIGIRARRLQDQSKLVFHRYADHYFLSQAQVWTEGESVAHKLVRSRQEAEMARKQVKEEIALLVR